MSGDDPLNGCLDCGKAGGADGSTPEGELGVLGNLAAGAGVLGGEDPLSDADNASHLGIPGGFGKKENGSRAAQAAFVAGTAASEGWGTKLLKGLKWIAKKLGPIGDLFKRSSKAPKPSPSGCFAEGTKVQTAEGAKRIEEVRAGDLVLSWDGETKAWIWSRVVRVFAHEYTGTMVFLSVGGEEIVASGNHPICVVSPGIESRPLSDEVAPNEAECGDGGRWLSAESIVASDELLLYDRLASVQWITQFEASHVVYNLEVEGSHTYAVSDANLLVHNKSMRAPTPTSLEGVATHVSNNGRLPENFITKEQARELGWVPRRGNLQEVAPGKSIGGDPWQNRRGQLPAAEGRQYFEADLNYSGGYRGDERLIYSNDGLMFYTNDHYRSFTPVSVE